MQRPIEPSPAPAPWAVQPDAGLDDAARLHVLASFAIDGLEDDPRLQAITQFAATLCSAPVSLASFVEAERQWFPARTGIDVRETHRQASFCAHAMRRPDVMVVTDARDDPRFADNILVTGEPFIRFYAGAPICAEDGTPLGALCVIDREPREGLTATQREGLKVLAANVVTLLTLRRANMRASQKLDETEAKFRVLADAMPQMVWSSRPDGYHDYYNARWYDFTGMEPGSTDGEAWNGMFHPDDRDRAWSVWRQSLASGDPYEVEYRLRNAAGEYRWTLGRALPIRSDDGAIQRWFGTCTDIHESRLLQEQREVVTHELSHRIKNIFSIISGLVSLEMRTDPSIAAVAASLQQRILALGRAHDFVRPYDQEGRAAGLRRNSLHGLVRALLEPYELTGAARIIIEGEDIVIDDRSATPFALVFHELATNAAKYGAFSDAGGRVHIASEVADHHACLTWTENGGPPPAAVLDEGFGCRLIELSIKRQMGGTFSKDWRESGLIMQMKVPTSSIYRTANQHYRHREA